MMDFWNNRYDHDHMVQADLAHYPLGEQEWSGIVAITMHLG